MYKQAKNLFLFILQDMPRQTNRLKRKHSKSSPPVLESPVKRQRSKQWTKVQMGEAIKSAKSGRGINRAAIEHGTLPSTLKDRLSSRVRGDMSGPPRYLNQEEETKLSGVLKECSSIGWGKTRQDVLKIAESVAKEKHILRHDKITQGWWRGFMERQKDLSLRQGDNTAHIRMDAVNADTMTHYFDLLKKNLK